MLCTHFSLTRCWNATCAIATCIADVVVLVVIVRVVYYTSSIRCRRAGRAGMRTWKNRTELELIAGNLNNTHCCIKRSLSSSSSHIAKNNIFRWSQSVFNVVVVAAGRRFPYGSRRRRHPRNNARVARFAVRALLSLFTGAVSRTTSHTIGTYCRPPGQQLIIITITLDAQRYYSG